ncbi:hypothetical protein SDC9_187075 [bioreactor metagenome]|uniref:Uncharacterized protein n=1 Tax=bioreactor metagenome TaxID=1076179 RepID=A0A645HKN2_9ZZZZ
MVPDAAGVFAVTAGIELTSDFTVATCTAAAVAAGAAVCATAGAAPMAVWALVNRASAKSTVLMRNFDNPRTSLLLSLFNAF